MKKIIKTQTILYLFLLISIIGCLQKKHVNKYPVSASQKIDTNQIAVLEIPKKESTTWEVKTAKATTLSESELKQT